MSQDFKKHRLHFVDLFCGIGGFHLGLKDHTCVFACDNHVHTARAYEANFNLRALRDIAQVNLADIPAHDVLCAGFPCQSFSKSGNRKGLTDSRGALFFDIVNIARYHKPQILLLENVPDLLSVDKGEVFKIIQYQLDKIGYHVHTCILDAVRFGVPQSRKRLYFRCLRKDANLDLSPVTGSDNFAVLNDVLDNDMPDNEQRDLMPKTTKQFYITHALGTQRMNKPARIGHYGNEGDEKRPGGATQGTRVYAPNGTALTTNASGINIGRQTGLYLINDRVRILSHLETKRVMGFPDDHIISPGPAGYKQLGNAVVPAVIKSPAAIH